MRQHMARDKELLEELAPLTSIQRQSLLTISGNQEGGNRDSPSKDSKGKRPF